MLHRLTIALILIAFASFTEVAMAQSNACRQLNARLVSLTNSSDFRQSSRSASAAKKEESQLKRIERRYVRDGCNADAKAGRRLTAQCRGLANQILAHRKNLEKLQQKAQGGRDTAAARETVLQQIARYNCRAKPSRSTVTLANRQKPKNLFETLFGNLLGTGQTTRGNGLYNDDDYYGFEDYYGDTVRSLCVRTCDGYYWPVSFSTSTDYLDGDAAACQAQCPAAEVELYYHDNPGETAQEMISLSGASYQSHPNAFKYRKSFDASCTCKQKVDKGKIKLIKSAETNITRAVIAFANFDIPLPPKDPRRPAKVIEVAEIIHIALPRRRPGSEPVQVISTKIAVNAANQRFFKIDGKTIRLVGPRTPYVPVGAEES